MIGRRIKELRNSQKLTQKELSDGIVSRTYLSLIEKGSVQPSNNVLVKLSKRLGVSVNDLMVESQNYQYSDIDMSREIIFYENKVKNKEYDVISDFIEERFEEKEDIQKIDLARIYLIYSEYYINTSHYKTGKDYLTRAENILLKMPINDYYIRYTILLSNIYLKDDDVDSALDVLERSKTEISYTNQFQLEMIQILYLMTKAYFKKAQYYTVTRLINELEKLSRQLQLDYKVNKVRYMKSISLYHEKKFDTLELLTENHNEIYDKVLYTYCLIVKGDVKSARQVYETIEPTRRYEALNEIIDDLNERFSSIM